MKGLARWPPRAWGKPSLHDVAMAGRPDEVIEHADGTREAPQTVVISYEKTEGSSFIQHHCGSIVLVARKCSSTPTTTGTSARASPRAADRRAA